MYSICIMHGSSRARSFRLCSFVCFKIPLRSSTAFAPSFSPSRDHNNHSSANASPELISSLPSTILGENDPHCSSAAAASDVTRMEDYRRREMSVILEISRGRNARGIPRVARLEECEGGAGSRCEGDLRRRS